MSQGHLACYSASCVPLRSEPSPGLLLLLHTALSELILLDVSLVWLQFLIFVNSEGSNLILRKLLFHMGDLISGKPGKLQN